MNVTVDRAAFLAELQLCAAITPRRPTIPILAAVRIGAEKDRVTLGATDLDLTILTSCAAEIVETGELCVEAQVLLEMVRSLDGETVTLTGGESGKPVTVTSGAARFDTPTWPAEDFPVLPEIEGKAARTMELATLQALLIMTRGALGEGDAKFDATRTCLRFRDGEVKAFAVQGNWLAEAWTAIPRQPGNAVYGLREVAGRLLVKFEAVGNAEAWFTANEDHLAITVDHRTLMDRQRDLNFPDYEGNMPKIADRAIVNRETLLAVIARANITARGTYSKCLQLTFGPGKLEITHKNTERGAFSETVPIEYTGAEEAIVGYNGEYLASALRIMTSRAVELGLATQGSGWGRHLFVTPTPESDIHQLAMIAGMRTV